jgi:hypothetical protein
MSDRIIQFSQLGNFGRLGNQMFQYAFARAYAEKHNAVLEIPNWIGESIFKNVSHPPLSKRLPRMTLDKIPWGEVNIDLFGYFQFKECFDILSESKLREWFTFQDRWLEKYSKRNGDVVAHIRRGDYVEKYPNVFCIISENSYIQACRKYDLDEKNLIWLSEEKPTVDSTTKEVSYTKQKNSMYGSGIYKDKGISFLPDFFRMINADVLLRANSTFSFWAGFFRNGRRTYSPAVGNKVGYCDVEFIAGNWPSLVPAHDDIIFG